MTKDEALRLALEVLEYSVSPGKKNPAIIAIIAITAIEQVLGQQEPEIVALRQLVEQALKGDLCADSDEDLALILKARKELAEITSPPKREWRGLHPSEYCGQSSEWCEGALWAAKILKEQNT